MLLDTQVKKIGPTTLDLSSHSGAHVLTAMATPFILKVESRVFLSVNLLVGVNLGKNKSFLLF